MFDTLNLVAFFLMWNGPSPPRPLRAPGDPGVPEGSQNKYPEIYTKMIISLVVEVWSGKSRARGGRAPGALGAPAMTLSTYYKKSLDLQTEICLFETLKMCYLPKGLCEAEAGWCQFDSFHFNVSREGCLKMFYPPKGHCES